MIYSIFETEFGWCVIIGEEGSPSEIIPFLPTRKDAYSRIILNYADMIDDSCCFKELKEAIGRYFSGEKIVFELPLDLSNYTQFQRGVWEITRSIPYGEIRTYGWIAKKLGNPRSSRAVGAALARNPLPIVIPCHRVVRSNGELGGYSAVGGIDSKTELLKMEGHKFDSKGRLPVFN